MSKIHFLPVKYGDSFVVECDKEGQHGVVVVDGGPTGYGKVLQEKVDETGTPDLLVLTHYDDDHIGGLTQYINTCLTKGVFPAKEVWANCAGYVEMEEDVMTKSVSQGVKLSKLLNTLENTGKMEWRDDIEEGLAREFPFASIEVVSPTAEVRGLVIEKQVEEGAKQKMKAKKIEVDELSIPLEELAKETPKAPNLKTASELANAASIAFILRCDGLSVLMLGDCYPHNVEAYLRNKGYSEDKPLEVDFVKVSHHGSKHNTSNELLDIVKCNHYGNAVTSMPYNEQIFVIDDEISTTKYIPRETLRRVATPQAYKFGKLDWAYHKAFEEEIGIYGSAYTNTMMVELGERLYFAAGSDKNIKLTTKDDLELFKAYLAMDKKDGFLK